MTDRQMNNRITKLQWKENISSRLDSKALKTALPDVYGQFCKASTSRRFTIA